MRVSFLTSALLIAALGQVGVASASVLIDDFDGTTLDTTKWIVTSGAPTVSDSVLSMTGSEWSTRDRIDSVAAYDNGIDILVAAAPTGRGYLGVQTADGNSNFLIRTDGINDTYPSWVAEVWNVTVSGQPDTEDSSAFTISAGDVLGLRYTTTGVALYQNGSLLWETTSGLGLSAADAHIVLASSGDGNTAPNAVEVGSVSHCPVPEPHAVVLLLTGLFGLLAYAWRKRK